MGGARSFAIVIAALLTFSGCASPLVASPDHLQRQIAAAELSYRELAPDQRRGYNTALGSIALARLPIGFPFHSIMGEKHNGAGSDGVVRYASSHLDGANSELVVRSGHNAFNNSEARSEVIRILREELQRSPLKPRRSTMLASYAEERNIVFPKRTVPREDF